MLKKLTVSNLAIVERAEAEFVPGLNVITGETGAGKSVIMGSLELVLGSRADASSVREGAAEAEVEAEFDGFTVRRTLTASGKSRAWIDDESVTLAELRDRVAGEVDIHGPRANQRLADEVFQREALDSFGGTDLAAYAAAWGKLVALRTEIAELGRTEASEDECDFLRFQVNELESAGISADDDGIAERHAAAAHAEEIVEAANAITEALGGDRGAADTLGRAMPHFAAVERHLPSAAEWRQRAESILIDLQELSRNVADAASAMEIDEEEFRRLDDRLGVVSRLKRKYLKGLSDQSAAALVGVLEAKRSRLAALEHRDERLAALEKAAAAGLTEVKRLGAKVSKVRLAAAERLSAAVTAELRSLGFARGNFKVTLETIEPEAHGCDRVTYWFEPNPGESARPLAVIASSGEIARVMLAMKTVLAAHDRTATLVFDEIDANIGGEVGAQVGARLRKVACGRQVIAITHLPQSAAFAERHFVVSKRVSGGRTRTAIGVVDGEERVSEIARMLGGEKITSVVKKHAKELIELSR